MAKLLSTHGIWKGWIGKHRFGQITMVAALSMLSTEVFAYLDPSTGSMVISVIVGIFASIALAVKTYWYKLKNLFRRSDKPTSSHIEDPPPEA